MPGRPKRMLARLSQIENALGPHLHELLELVPEQFRTEFPPDDDSDTSDRYATWRAWREADLAATNLLWALAELHEALSRRAPSPVS